MERQTTEVKFYDSVEDSLLKFAVIIAKKDGKWVLCKHRDRNTYEVPGGHREPGEAIMDTAKRELHSEIEKVFLFDDLPDQWTYPLIQPKLLEEFYRRGI